MIIGRPAHLRRLQPWAWVITIAGFVFAVGPGAGIGNTFFGNPNNQKTLLFGMPSIWLWQVMWWLLGVVMIWFLAYKMQLSTMPEKEIIALLEDVCRRQEVKSVRAARCMIGYDRWRKWAEVRFAAPDGLP